MQSAISRLDDLLNNLEKLEKLKGSIISNTAPSSKTSVENLHLENEFKELLALRKMLDDGGGGGGKGLPQLIQMEMLGENDYIMESPADKLSKAVLHSSGKPFKVVHIPPNSDNVSRRKPLRDEWNKISSNEEPNEKIPNDSLPVTPFKIDDNKGDSKGRFGIDSPPNYNYYPAQVLESANDNLDQLSKEEIANLHSKDNLRDDQAVMMSDADRLKLPLIGTSFVAKQNNNFEETFGPNTETMNIVMAPSQQSGKPEVVTAFRPGSKDKNDLNQSISELLGADIDIDELIRNVTQSMGTVSEPMRVQETHTRIVTGSGERSKLNESEYSISKTLADILPGKDPKNPLVKVLSKDVKTNSSSDDSAAPLQTNRPYNGTVNVSTKTNIINIFAFNIMNNNHGLNKSQVGPVGGPIRTNIHTEAKIEPESGKEVSSIYDYNASSDKSEGEGIEKWMKILLSYQGMDKKPETFPTDDLMSYVANLGAPTMEEINFTSTTPRSFSVARDETEISNNNVHPSLPTPILSFLAQQDVCAKYQSKFHDEKVNYELLPWI